MGKAGRKPQSGKQPVWGALARDAAAKAQREVDKAKLRPCTCPDAYCARHGHYLGRR